MLFINFHLQTLRLNYTHKKTVGVHTPTVV